MNVLFIHLNLLLLISKIPHFESNSQQRLKGGKRIAVVTDIKDTSFWKQFTTLYKNEKSNHLLLLISKIPHFESNSQQVMQCLHHEKSCYWYQRYLILKAIHNNALMICFSLTVVTDIKDTSFWKQFTTHCVTDG